MKRQSAAKMTLIKKITSDWYFHYRIAIFHVDQIIHSHVFLIPRVRYKKSFQNTNNHCMSNVKYTVQALSYWTKASIPESFRRREWGQLRGKIPAAWLWQMSCLWLCDKGTMLSLHANTSTSHSPHYLIGNDLFQFTTFSPQTCKRVISMRPYTLMATPPPPSAIMFSVKAICLHRCDYSVYCTSANTKQRIWSRKQEAGSNRHSNTALICQPCETMGQGLVMWFRWVSHAGVSQPSPLSAPATVPHYTARHHRLYLQQAFWFLTQGHPFFHPSLCWNDRKE